MKFTLLVFVLTFSTATSFAGWSANIAYNNPPGNQIGLNFMHLWSEWAGEVGLGYYKSGKDDKDRSAHILSGSLNAKYFMMTGQSFRPYAQLGSGWGFSTTGESTALNFGETLYIGAGFFVVGSGVYTYASYNTGLGDAFIQAGLGFDL